MLTLEKVLFSCSGVAQAIAAGPWRERVSADLASELLIYENQMIDRIMN